MTFSLDCGFLGTQYVLLNNSQLTFIVVWHAQDHYFTIKFAILITAVSSYEYAHGDSSNARLN